MRSLPSFASRAFLQWVVPGLALASSITTPPLLPDASAKRGLRLACRYIPGDAGWPSTAEWNLLNATVGGRLIATNPLGHICHNPTYSEAECNALKQDWGTPARAVPRPAEFLSPWFQNQTCVPFTAESTPCTLGNYASYSINVTCPGDIAAGLAFAESHNIRLVIKNTGHDFLGKSTGKGSLSLWTHNLKSIELLQNYRSSYYEGPALKIGAGVLGGDASQFAWEHGYRVIAGNCPTVGIAGGYTQGGGFSVLSGLYGLGADNVLEWEVVLASGELVLATPTQNSDLYWALSGGGGGTYGVVTSMTTRLFPEQAVAAASFALTVHAAGSVEAYWQGVQLFHEHLQPLFDSHGVVAAYTVTNESLSVYEMLAPDGATVGELTTLLAPLTDALTQQLNVTLASLDFVTYNNDTYFGFYSSLLEPLLAVEPVSPVLAGRFLLRDQVAGNITNIMTALQAATGSGSFEWVCEGVNADTLSGAPGKVAPVAANAVTPSWRGALAECLIVALWYWQVDDVNPANWPVVAELQNELNNTIMPVVEALTPGAGAYMNEASWLQTDFQDAFFGGNYPRLKTIKDKYDPSHLFYAVTGVGSEVWAPNAEGRLCQTGKS